ncbi:MAG: tRNA dihydrouridine(20/20a) synthase DusA [Alphaproteobacteria bacterium]|nr:tRNA dihydrouridine(20/20a) synthase DusA [Alphaproteobacteria bacterium]
MEFSVAPMMDWTDRHCRYFHRILAPNMLLYTEMVTTGALIFGDKSRHLDFNKKEHPLALQLGGSSPEDLAKSAKFGEDWGYNEINLNCGCPSNRVQKGSFGACLMAEPDLVAACIKSMQDAVKIPVTVKCRIAIDDFEEEPFLYDFIKKISDIGCTTFIVHARKAWLKGLSPKENRDIPPLNYDLVFKLKEDFPNLSIHLNGGVTSRGIINSAYGKVDGIMIGREAYQNPWFLTEIENEFYGTPFPHEEVIIENMSKYLKNMLKTQTNLRPRNVTRHMTGLFKGAYGGKTWRQALSTLPESPDMIEKAYEAYLSKNSAAHNSPSA